MEHKKRVNSLRIILQQQDVGHRPVKITKQEEGSSKHSKLSSSNSSNSSKQLKLMGLLNSNHNNNRINPWSQLVSCQILRELRKNKNESDETRLYFYLETIQYLSVDNHFMARISINSTVRYKTIRTLMGINKLLPQEDKFQDLSVVLIQLIATSLMAIAIYLRML